MLRSASTMPRSRAAFELHDAFIGDAHSAPDLLDILDREAQADATAGWYRAGKAHPVGAVIDPARALLDAVDG